MNEKKNQKQKKNLITMGLIDERDNVVDFFNVTYAQRTISNRLRTWEKGWIYFTEEKIICLTGLLNDNIIIPYHRIQTMETFSYLLMPLGLDIKHISADGQQVLFDSFLIWKRRQWVDFLEKKSGILCCK